MNNKYDVEAIVKLVSSKSDIEPYDYDGSYELMQEIVRSYSRMKNINDIDYHDLNCVYLSVIISSTCGIDSKKNSIKNSNLPENEKERLLGIADKVWSKTIKGEYRHQEDGPNTLGMFGSGFLSFKRTTTSKDARDFIQMCIEIWDKTDDGEIFNRAEDLLKNNVRGLKAASASVMLHCLKPTVFPILNGNMGTNNIFEALGIDIKKRSELKTYISNCRKIKKFRDEHFTFKNYRVIDLAQRDIDKYIIETTTNVINVDILKNEIEDYKRDFNRVIEEENYKWEAVKCFQDNFDINAEDFAAMLDKAFSKCDNLLTRSHYFPVGVIKEIAQYDQNYTRDMFSKLYDESKPVLDRINQFTEASEIYYQFKDNDKLNTYQDAPAISVYLFLKYPDQYYIYMSRKFECVAKRLAYGDIPKGGSLDRVGAYIDMANQIWEYVKTDKELLELNRSRITDACYDDPLNHILAEDIIYYINRKYRDNNESSNDGFWPSYDEYPVDITKDDWKRFINEVEFPTHKGCMRVLKCYLDIGGIAAPKKMSEMYKGHSMVYTSSVSNTSRRALKYFDMEPCIDQRDNSQWQFPIAFQGKAGEGTDKGTYVYKMRPELMEALKEIDLSEIELEYKKKAPDMNNSKYKKNLILYGPPGTGKTYNSILYAVAICEGSSIEELQAEEYSDVIDRFNELRNEGRIAFTTFHQSYGYEEFIEGIKPIVDDSEDDDGDIRYSVEDGIFKKFCERASLPISSTKAADNYGLNKNPVVWKVSLEGTGDNPTRTECLENDHIRIGWDRYGEVITDDTEFTNGGRIVLNSFINKMQVGDLVLSCYSASTIDAIGVVTGDYEWHPEYSAHKRLRNVRWLAKNIKYNILELNGNTSMTLSTVYKMKLTVADVFKILDEVGVSEGSSSKNEDKPYVFIIDEINRGNISKIFGELITLIEPSKRIGKAEELCVELPYSQKQFGVPDNVYILGTMNTADRSIALMDTALRRRFQFVEMMPDSEVLKDIIIEQDGETIDIAEMLKIINLRIEYLYDREHTIGHAYFMPILNNPSIDTLAEIFDTNIIPLLKEYFYEDYGKIQMILGDNKKSSDELKFVKETKLITKDIFNGDTSELDLPEQIYSIQKEALYNIRSYKEISKDL